MIITYSFDRQYGPQRAGKVAGRSYALLLEPINLNMYEGRPFYQPSTVSTIISSSRLPVDFSSSQQAPIPVFCGYSASYLTRAEAVSGLPIKVAGQNNFGTRLQFRNIGCYSKRYCTSSYTYQRYKRASILVVWQPDYHFGTPCKSGLGWASRFLVRYRKR